MRKIGLYPGVASSKSRLRTIGVDGGKQRSIDPNMMVFTHQDARRDADNE